MHKSKVQFEIFSLFGCFPASVDILTLEDVKNVSNKLPLTMCNIPHDRRPRLHHGKSLKLYNIQMHDTYICLYKKWFKEKLNICLNGFRGRLELEN